MSFLKIHKIHKKVYITIHQLYLQMGDNTSEENQFAQKNIRLLGIRQYLQTNCINKDDNIHKRILITYI